LEYTQAWHQLENNFKIHLAPFDREAKGRVVLFLILLSRARRLLLPQSPFAPLGAAHPHTAQM
jgi:hypothetical protein